MSQATWIKSMLVAAAISWSAGCSTSPDQRQEAKGTSPKDAKSLYSVPPWYESLLRFNDQSNADDSKSAVKQFDEFVASTAGPNSAATGNIEAERSWSKTINEVAKQNGDLERAGFLVDGAMTWSGMRDSVYQIVSVDPKGKDDVDARVKVRLEQLGIIRKLLGRWAEYEGKQVEKATKALKDAKGYLDEADELKLPEIIWRHYEKSGEKQTITVDMKSLVPSSVTITQIAEASVSTSTDETAKPTAGGGTGDDLTVVTIAIDENYDRPFDVNLSLTYKTTNNSTARTAKAKIRVFSKDAAELAWTRFGGAVVRAGQNWVKQWMKRNEELAATFGKEGDDKKFAKKLSERDKDMKLADSVMKILADELVFAGEEKTRRDEFRKGLVDDFLQAWTEIKNKTPKAPEEESFKVAFRVMVAQDDPRLAIDAALNRGTDPVAVYALVAALRNGLNTQEEALLNSYIDHLNAQFKVAGISMVDVTDPKNLPKDQRRPEDAVKIVENQVSWSSYLQTAEILRAIAIEPRKADEQPASAKKSVPATKPYEPSQFSVDYDDGFTEQLREIAKDVNKYVVRKFGDPPSTSPATRAWLGGADRYSALKLGMAQSASERVGATTLPTSGNDPVEPYLPAYRRMQAAQQLLPQFSQQVKRLELAVEGTVGENVPGSGTVDGAPNPILAAPTGGETIADVRKLKPREVGELLVESAIPLELISFAGTVTKDEKLKSTLGQLEKLVTRLQQDRAAAYIRLGDYIVELQQIRLAALQENVRHVGALTGVVDAEVLRWEMVNQQAKRFQELYGVARSENPATFDNDMVLSSLRGDAIDAGAAQRNVKQRLYPGTQPFFATLRRTIDMVNAYLAVGAINERLGLANQLDLKMEVKLHEVNAQALALRPQEADIRFLLREQSELMSSGVTSKDVFDVLQTGLIGWIGAKE